MNYIDIYLNNFFTTFGQLSGFMISTAIAVPILKYYKNYIQSELS